MRGPGTKEAVYREKKEQGGEICQWGEKKKTSKCECMRHTRAIKKRNNMERVQNQLSRKLDHAEKRPERKLGRKGGTS